MTPVTGIFTSPTEARRVAARLVSLGIPMDHVSVLSPGTADVESIPTVEAEPPGFGRAIGGVVGGATGLQTAALLSLVVPGVGPVAVLGVAGAALFGLAGAAIGGRLSDALRDGLPRDEVFVYEDALRKGRSVIVALADDDAQAARASELMTGAGAESVDAARDAWWVGLRDAEKAEYSAAGGDFTRDEDRYRAGFEAAVGPMRGRRYEEALADLERRYAAVCRDAAFRRGYERGCVYVELHLRRDDAA